MKVEILRQQRNSLHNELEYDLFFSLFTQDQPLLSSVILRYLDKEEAVSHYAQLAAMAKIFESEERERILTQSAALPPLDHLLSHFEKGQLEQYHLFELGNFLHNNTILCLLEKPFPLDTRAEQSLGRILHILKRYTENAFSSIRINRSVKAVRADLAAVEKDLNEAARRYEKQIADRTTLTMVYPWPREMSLDEEQVSNIESCDLLTLKEKGDIWLIDYSIQPELQEAQNRKNELNKRHQSLMEKQLRHLNEELSALTSCLREYYQKRVQRTWLYVLLSGKEKNNLCLPGFTSTRGCHIEKGSLYGLKARKEETYVPLDIGLERGASVLYGANMSGKTTVLKTVYFLLTLVQLGLPLPARKITLHYPEQVVLALKSPGDVRTMSSTYSEELSFFAQPMADGAYILSDELFLSTDPVNGVILSEILVQAMAVADRVFFCTTHYPEILEIKNCALYRMEDANPLLFDSDGYDLQSLDTFMPYRLALITDSDHDKIKSNRAPLQTALFFDLPGEIKEAIRKYLDGVQSS